MKNAKNKPYWYSWAGNGYMDLHEKSLNSPFSNTDELRSIQEGIYLVFKVRVRTVGQKQGAQLGSA